MNPLAELDGAGVHRDTVLTIGVFDGVHVGHRYLIDQVKATAAAWDLASAVVTFRNHPGTVLAPHGEFVYLSSLEQRLELLRDTGVDYVVPLTFTPQLSQVAARVFVKALIDKVRMRQLLIGPDFALGRNREGTYPVLQALGRELGFDVNHQDPLVHEGHIVSSTSIREALATGDVHKAPGLLGRNYSLHGPVVLGDRRGRTLGFPTANVEVHHDDALPADGIYCTVAWVDRKPMDSVTNVGVRPTFGTLGRTVETFIMDFEGDLYGKEITLDFIERLRREERFESADSLVEQMGRDVEAAQGVLQRRVQR